MALMKENKDYFEITDRRNHGDGAEPHRHPLTVQGRSTYFLIRQIRRATSFSDIQHIHSRLPHIIQEVMNSGAKSKNVNRMITTISDAILRKIIMLSIQQVGNPPTPFVFMVLGSEGRKEQTLKTDQDNAVIYEDVPKIDRKRVKHYFLRLGKRVCDRLDMAGYAYCSGGIMAKNEKWCQSLSMWKMDFYHWIHAAFPEDLLQASIFFDFRGVYGNLKLIDELRKFLFSSLTGWAGFFRHLTENALYFKPPLGFFRNFIVESKGEHRNQFDIKRAMMPIVDFARIYALKNGIAETNTQKRLEQLMRRSVLSRFEYEELALSYGFLMQQRFLNQINNILHQNAPPDNYINPKILSEMEQYILKVIFKTIEKYQTKLDFEFTSMT